MLGVKQQKLGFSPSDFSLQQNKVYSRRKLCALVASGVILILVAICIAVVPRLNKSSAVIPTPKQTPLQVTNTSATTTTTTSTTTPSPQPRPPVPTTHPLPPSFDIQKLPAKTLLIQVGLMLNWTQISCGPEYPPAFLYVLRIEGVPNKNYTGESDKIIHAEEAASIKAVKDLFDIVYHNRTEPPPPPRPCFANATILQDISGEIMEDSMETKHVLSSSTIPDEDQI